MTKTEEALQQLRITIALLEDHAHRTNQTVQHINRNLENIRDRVTRLETTLEHRETRRKEQTGHSTLILSAVVGASAGSLANPLLQRLIPQPER